MVNEAGFFASVLVEGEPYPKTYLDTLGFSPSQHDALRDRGILNVDAHGMVRFQFVGALVSRIRVIYLVPKFFSGADPVVGDGEFYVKSIRQYLIRASKRKSIAFEMSDQALIARTYELLDDYYNRFGPYRAVARVVERCGHGPINWKKTIARNTAVFSASPELSDSKTPISFVLYPEPLRHAIRQFDCSATRLFELVHRMLSSFLAPIFGRSQIPSNRSQNAILAREVDELLTHKKSRYLQMLKASIPKESGVRRRVLEVLHAFLLLDSRALERVAPGRFFAFGTDRFENVWEDACLAVTGAERGCQGIAQPTFSPLSHSAKTLIAVGSQRPDGWVFNANKTESIILDAKYYWESKERIVRLPTHDIMKQIGYTLSSKHSASPARGSCFLLPSGVNEEHTFCLVGDINMMQNGTALADPAPIRVYKLSPTEVFARYMNSEIWQDLVKDLLRILPNDATKEESEQPQLSDIQVEVIVKEVEALDTYSGASKEKVTHSHVKRTLSVHYGELVSLADRGEPVGFCCPRNVSFYLVRLGPPIQNGGFARYPIELGRHHIGISTKHASKQIVLWGADWPFLVEIESAKFTMASLRENKPYLSVARDRVFIFIEGSRIDITDDCSRICFESDLFIEKE